jgi:hypothetical protein
MDADYKATIYDDYLSVSHQSQQGMCTQHFMPRDWDRLWKGFLTLEIALGYAEVCLIIGSSFEKVSGFNPEKSTVALLGLFHSHPYSGT